MQNTIVLFTKDGYHFVTGDSGMERKKSAKKRNKHKNDRYLKRQHDKEVKKLTALRQGCIQHQENFISEGTIDLGPIMYSLKSRKDVSL